MAWSPMFSMDLTHKSVEPKFLLRFNGLPNFIGDSLTLGGGYPQSNYPAIANSGPTIRGTSVIPGTWNVSFGSFTVPIVGDIRKLFPTITKGSIAELYIDLNGLTERVAIGQLRNIKGFGKSWKLEFVDIITAMGTRIDGRLGSTPFGNDPDKQKLFYNLGKEVNLTSNWHHSGGNYPATISVDDVRPFELETGQTGIARCIDASNNEFYIEYNGTSVTSSPAGTINLAFTHTTSSIIYPSILPCTNLNSSDGKIYSAAILRGKPFDIFGKILLSRSGNSIHTLDKYPQSYNFGAYLNTSTFDRGDALSQTYIKSSIPSSTTYDWGLVLTSPLNNGIRDFITTSALTGQWPTWRQNSITWRGCQVPEDAQNIAATIEDSNIISITNIDIFDPNNKASYYRSKNIYGINSSSIELSNQINSSAGEQKYLPAESIKQRDIKFVYGPNPNTAPTDRLRCSLGDLRRLVEWDTRAWSKIQLQLQMKYARLTCGDIVEIKSRYIDFYKPSNVKKLWHRAMVLSVDYQILNSYCSVQLAILI